MYTKHLKIVSHSFVPARLGAILLLAALVLGVWPMPVTRAAPYVTITVDTVADELNGSSGNGDCSLREAIANANNNNAAQVDCASGSNASDVIELDALTSTYTLSRAGSGEDGNATGDLDITEGLTINGNNATVRAGTHAANGIDRVLDIHAGVVEINDVTIQYGLALAGADGINGGQGEYGGGIQVAGTCALTLNRCTVASNSAGAGGNGIGVGSTAGWGGRGGGIYVEGTLVLNQSAVSGNDAGDGGNGGGGMSGALGGPGGGIATGGSASSVTLNASTISGNFAGDGGDGNGAIGGSGGTGGGIYVATSSSLAATNSTISGNYTGNPGSGSPTGNPGLGGGVRNAGNASFTHCTFAQNTAASGGAGNAIHTSGTTTLANTILNSGAASNTCAGGGTFTSGGYNIDDGTSCGLGAGTDDLNSTDPSLAALADNGGPTWTHALQFPSDAIDHIPEGSNGCVGGVSVDQRGAVRNDGSNRGGWGCDVGAFEYGSRQTPAAITLSNLVVHQAPRAYVVLLLAVPVLSVVAVLLYRRRSA